MYSDAQNLKINILTLNVNSIQSWPHFEFQPTFSTADRAPFLYFLRIVFPKILSLSDSDDLLHKYFN